MGGIKTETYKKKKKTVIVFLHGDECGFRGRGTGFIKGAATICGRFNLLMTFLFAVRERIVT